MRAAIFTLLLCACSRPAPSRTGIAAGAAAQARGIARYDVLSADATSLDAVVHGAVGGRVRVHAGPSLTEQVLERGDGRLVLRTSASRVEVESDGGTRLILDRAGDAWNVREPLPPEAAADVATLLAIDVDLAVQASSLVWDGSAYVACTVSCEDAASCTSKRGLAPACAQSVVVCGACLEQEPP